MCIAFTAYSHDDTMVLTLKRESMMPGGFLSQKASNAELWCLLYYLPEQTFEQTVESPLI